MEKGTVNPSDVILTVNGQIGIVTMLKKGNAKYPVVYKTKKGANVYKCSYGDVKAVIGKVTDEGMSEFDTPEPVNNSMLPEKLKGVEAGVTKLELTSGDVVTFMDYKSSRPKHPVVYMTKRGARYKTSIASVNAIVA